VATANEAAHFIDNYEGMRKTSIDVPGINIILNHRVKVPLMNPSDNNSFIDFSYF
jgi:hypothetical protein